MKKEKKEVKDPGEQADDEESKATEQSEEGASLTTEQKMEDLDETILSMSMQDFDREVMEKEFVNLVQHYQHILNSFTKLVNEVPHMKK